MSFTVYFDTVNKRRNSTLQPEVEHPYTCTLKDSTSLDEPVFLLKDAEKFEYNYAKWGNDYYFVTEVTSYRNDLWEVSCKLDVLATFKSEILDTYAFVAYSDSDYNEWLVDERLPFTAQPFVSENRVGTEGFIDAETPNNVLTVLSDTGAKSYSVPDSMLSRMCSKLETLVDLKVTDEEVETEADIAGAINKLNVFSNAFGNTVECIKSCVKVPFSHFGANIGLETMHLGIYDMDASGTPLGPVNVVDLLPVTGSKEIQIPWRHNYWRRKSPYSQVYLYLPFVGSVELSSDNLCHENWLTIYYSYTLSDGQVMYEVHAGRGESVGELIGIFNGGCVTSIPIGILQPKTVGQGNHVQGTANFVASAIQSVTDIINSKFGESNKSGVSETRLFTNPSYIGNTGGGAGAGLETDIICTVVSHDSSDTDFLNVMGKPKMKRRTLDGLEGYCECVGATVIAPAHAEQLEEINLFLNSGFFIE